MLSRFFVCYFFINCGKNASQGLALSVMQNKHQLGKHKISLPMEISPPSRNFYNQKQIFSQSLNGFLSLFLQKIFDEKECLF